MAGLLDFNDPQTVGLLGTALGLLSGSGPSRLPVSFGQVAGQAGLQGLGMAQQTQAQNTARNLQEAQLKHLNTTDELTRLQVEAAIRNQAVQNSLLQGLGLLPNGPASQGGAASGGSTPTSAVISNPEANTAYGVPFSGAQSTPDQTGNVTSAIPPGLRTPAALDIAFNGGKGIGGMMATFAKPFSGRSGAPVWGVNPQTGQLEIQGFSPRLPEGATLGANGQVGVAPGYASTVTQLSGIPNLSAPMQTIKLSNQRELQLSQPEYVRYTQSGGQILPTRYKALAGEIPGVRFADSLSAPAPQAAPQNAPQVAPQASPQAAGSPAQSGSAINEPAVVGSTQSQEGAITQARQTSAGKAVDEQFAKDYVAFTSGGGAQDAQKQIAQLNDVKTALGTKGANLTGPVIGSVPDFALKFTNTGQNAIRMRERVEEVVQRSLRAILGAQFTEKEGERLIARAYNPNLPESENTIRVGRLLTQLKQAYATKADAAKYFEQHGTLQGWQGKLPTMADFDPGGGGQNTGGTIGGQGWSIRPVGKGG